MGLAYIGPVKVDFHGDPTFRFTSQLAPGGYREVEIGGFFDWGTADQLSELLANPDAAATLGGRYGVPAVIWCDDDLLGDFNGCYVLESFEQDAPQDSSLGHTPVGVALKGCLFGDIEFVVPRSSVPKDVPVGITARSLVVSPFRPEDDEGDRFVVDPGGTFGTREYDPRCPRDSAVPVPPDGTTRIGLYEGIVTDDADDLESLVYPKAHFGKDTPVWVASQGGNVRAHDRRSDRDVYGPHLFHESTDLRVENGLVSVWVGNRGLVPFLNVQVLAGGTWREVGVVQLGTLAPLRRARVTYITTELVVVALTIEGYGDILVRVRRGSRTIELTPSADLPPTWSGTPPVQDAVGVTNAPGRFDNGLSQDEASELLLRWPADVDEGEWAAVVSLTSDQAASGGTDAGLFTIYDDARAAAVQLFFDASDDRVKFRIGATTVQSSVQTFDIGDELVVGARFSETDGMTLSVRDQADAVEHVDDPTGTDPGTTGRYATIAFYGRQPTLGDVYDDLYVDLYGGSAVWGDGSSPGTRRLPGGVIDNVMIFEDRLADTEFATLAVATTPLGGLPAPEGRLRWYVPFDAEPIVELADENEDGELVDPVTDDNGVQKAIAFIDAAHIESAAILARSAVVDSIDSIAHQHRQVAAENTQKLRVR